MGYGERVARLRSPEKRKAILEAAVCEVAEAGLSAATAKIAARAGIASGTLFTYFKTKEELLNELYNELKLEVFERVNEDFPHKASLERRARHVWRCFLEWGIESPGRRAVALQLNVSGVVTNETRRRTAAERATIDETLKELDSRSGLDGLPAGFAGAILGAMQEATLDLVAREPDRREELIERAFQVYWRAVR